MKDQTNEDFNNSIYFVNPDGTKSLIAKIRVEDDELLSASPNTSKSVTNKDYTYDN